MPHWPLRLSETVRFVSENGHFSKFPKDSFLITKILTFWNEIWHIVKRYLPTRFTYAA